MLDKPAVAAGLSMIYTGPGTTRNVPNCKGACMSKILQSLQGTIIAGIVITVVMDLIVRYTF